MKNKGQVARTNRVARRTLWLRAALWHLEHFFPVLQLLTPIYSFDPYIQNVYKMSTLFRVFSQFLRCHSWKNLWKIVSSIISKNQATAGTRPYLLSEQILMVNLSTLPKSWLRFQSLHLHNLLVHSVTFLVKEKNRLAPLYLTFVQLESPTQHTEDSGKM